MIVTVTRTLTIQYQLTDADFPNLATATDRDIIREESKVPFKMAIDSPYIPTTIIEDEFELKR
jgi:hypothetical protein